MTGYCHDDKHDTPCPRPCVACDEECATDRTDSES